jgi:hypothetical protein
MTPLYGVLALLLSAADILILRRMCLLVICTLVNDIAATVYKVLGNLKDEQIRVATRFSQTSS